jgi:hypothetical protein
MSGKLIILFLKCFSKEFFLFQRVILPKRKTNFVLAVFEKKQKSTIPYYFSHDRLLENVNFLKIFFLFGFLLTS